MATIKIDRGFTQKIQHKTSEHTPFQQPGTPQKKPQGGNKKGPPVGVIIAGAAAAVLVTAVAVGFAVSSGKKAAGKPARPAVAPAPAQAPTPLQKAETPAPEQESAASRTEAPAPQPAQPQLPKQDFRPVLRDGPVGAPKGLLCEYYDKIPGKPISALRAAAEFPGRPSRTVQVANFELSDNIGNQYGVRVRGYLVPSASGKYRFSVCGDDSVELWLSDDDTPARLKKLVSYAAWVQKNQWTLRQDQQSSECELKAGQRYYLEAFLKEENGSDYLSVAWKGPVSETYQLIDSQFLQPWSEGAAPSAAEPAATSSPNGRQAREAAEAPARSAVDEQLRKHASAYRYAEAAEALKSGKASWDEPAARAFVETAILRLELLGRLRAFVQAELAKAPARGLWTAFGGKAADITTATDEGVTVAPGRIVEWAKIPPDQMLRMVNLLVPKAVADPNSKGVLFLAAAIMNKEVGGSLDMAFKYRERALSNHSGMASLADRVLGGTPESLQAEIRMKASRAELDRQTAPVAGLAEQVTKLQAGLAAASGLVPGVLVEYWDQNPYGNLDDARKKGLLNKKPDSVNGLRALEVPRDRAEKYVARLSGYLTPPETGDYYFYVAADDRGELWLSPDETPEKLALLIRTETHCNYRSWDKEKRRSKPVPLVKDKRYRVEALLLEGEKSDHLSVAWSPVAADEPKVVDASNVLYSASAVFTPQIQELRRQSESDLEKVLSLLSEGDRVRTADRLWVESDAPASNAAADELQRQVTAVKEALRSAESLIRQVEAALQQLQAASQPG